MCACLFIGRFIGDVRTWRDAPVSAGTLCGMKPPPCVAGVRMGPPRGFHQQTKHLSCYSWGPFHMAWLCFVGGIKSVGIIQYDLMSSVAFSVFETLSRRRFLEEKV